MASLAEKAVNLTLSNPSAVQSMYQPIVDLRSGYVVAVEALARWPELSGKLRTEDVFENARERGVLASIEWACRTAAVKGALNSGAGRNLTLFVNIESYVGFEDWPPPKYACDILRRAAEELRIVIELTERGLTVDPAITQRTVSWAREHSCAIALDDVGANKDTVDLLAVIAPDVVKLDASLIQKEDSEWSSRLAAVVECAERTGALIIAEGLETVAHRDKAIAAGATLGQGWLYGLPSMGIGS